ncbi:SprT family protein [Paenibacillus tarimensis]|uniref:SprT family protein n=1 Tax=Paenibacillus tarimensis TaxID=416012 RepID=UPI001F203115|nr:SprT family protein [Paenibacillus tarimensis]MCF2943671.1 SprT family protein [Paenibacillus tarimensis]
MTDDHLQAWVEKISLDSFGIPFRHRATFNRRLKATGGRYFMKSHNIEISPHQLENYGIEETEKIIKHELCHYHLHLLGRGYRHRDSDFKLLLEKVGGSRYCKSLPERLQRKPAPYKYMLKCTGCGMEYMRRRRMNPSKYRCGKCAGKLILKGLDSKKET